MFSFRKRTTIPSRDEALPGRAERHPHRRAALRQRRPLKGPYPAGAGDGHLRARLLLGRGAQVLAGPGRASSRPSAMPAASRPTPPMRRPARASPATTRWCWWCIDPEACQLRDAAEDLLGEPRPHAGHAAGQRCRHAVPLRRLCRPRRRSATRRRRSKASLRQGAGGQGLRRRSRRRSWTPARSTSPRTITSNTWRRTRAAIAGLAARGCRAPSARAWARAWA